MKKLLLLIFFTTNIFATDYCDGFIKNITTPDLCKLLSQAEQAAKNKNYKKAAELVDKALAMKTAPEFSTKAEANGPLSFNLKLAKVFLKFEELQNNKFKNSKELEKMILKLQKKYGKYAKDKKWKGYTWLLLRLTQYYSAVKDIPKLEKQVDKLYEYGGNDIVINFLYEGLKYNIPTSIANKMFNNYRKNSGTNYEWINFLRISYKHRDGGNVFQDSLDFLEAYPKAYPNNIITAIGFLKKTLKSNDKEKTKQCIEALNKLAFSQPNTKDRLKLVSKILDKKRELEKTISN